MSSIFRNVVTTSVVATALGLLMACSGPVAAQVVVIGGNSGSRIDGSGRMVDEARTVGAFSGLVVDGPIDVRLRAAAADRVIVHADDNIAPLIETRVADGKLVVGVVPKASYRTRSSTYVVVEFRELSSLTLRGSGDVRADIIRAPIFEVTLRGSGDVQIESLETDALALSISGSGDFSARGRATRLGVVVVGSGDVAVDKLESREAAVRIRGSGDVRVHATDSLQVDIAGSGDVRYRGEPKLSKKIAGSGELLPLR